MKTILDALGVFLVERAPQAAPRQRDLRFEVREPRDGWGVLRSTVAHRLVLLEYHARPPGKARIATSIAKLAQVAELWWQHNPAPGQKPPLLLVVSNGQPRKALGLLGAQPYLCKAIWSAELLGLAEIVVVDVKALPADEPGTGVLRFFRTSTTSDEASAALSSLREDPLLSPLTKQELVAALADGTIPTSEPERQSLRRSSAADGPAERSGSSLAPKTRKR